MPTPDDAMLRRALLLAIKGRGTCEPNPPVGCVVVRNNRIVGEGFHERPGTDHAEPVALREAGDAARDATAYVTLEPCAHDDASKRTPPCAPRLVAAGVSRVVVGCRDPNPKVDGRGFDVLRSAGVRVDLAGDPAPFRQLIAPFARRLAGLPYITLKWARSRDGRVAGKEGTPLRITGPDATAAVHALRGRCDAVIVGTNTLVNDDPQLTARTHNPPRTPLRVVLSNSLDFPKNPQLFDGTGGPVVVYTHDYAPDFRHSHVEVVRLPAIDTARGGRRFRILDAWQDLARRGCTHLLVEPGPKLARDLIAHNLADRAWVFHGTRDIGHDGLESPECPWPVVARARIGQDVLTEHLNPHSDAFFAPEPSADFLRTDPSFLQRRDV